MRISNYYVTALACVAPSVHGFTTIAPRTSSRILLLPIRNNPLPIISSRHFASSTGGDNTSSSSSAAADLVVKNDTSSLGGEQPQRNTTDTSSSVLDQNTTTMTDPNGSGDQLVVAQKKKEASSVIPPLPETLDASGLLSLDPTVVDIVQVPTKNHTDTANGQASRPSSLEAMMKGLPFVSMFRGSANYIANHRNTLAVYHIPGGLLDLPDPTVFRDLTNDIALTWLLGMKIVLVVGCRRQIEKRIPKRTRFFGIPVTDAETLRVVKEEAGYVRFEVERQLARSLRMQGGNNDNNTGAKSDHVDGNVVSGNFYSAQPFGVLDGIDYKYTGFVRKVEVEKIRQLHAGRDICLLTTLGVSPSGEVFNVNSEALAATVAGALDASKVIYFTEQEMELRHKVHGNKIQNLRLSDARNLMKHNDVTIHKRGFVTVGERSDELLPETDMLIKIGWATMALEQGVKRAHIISPKFGAVLQELYTRDGSGALISRDLYEGIRRANVNDVSNIYDLIYPLIKMGTLVDRPKAVLEKDVDSYYVFTRDELIVACGQLKIFEGEVKRYAEIGCLVVNQEYRARGRGDAMLGYLERLCFLNGATTVFVLSTQTMEWFVERGFTQVTVDKLPPSRQATYNHKRASQIYMKDINSSRDLDQSELWWNR
ncbi:Amino-acid acetyltransferase [Seminavis robusta]|uniref:amino-acid N-acetyltransferase n=1 Tax=Seminavis robusta TaxID=568900 RepID=A0A9N8EFG1_9STRA|nr:Amino-acid acetyltransferase [Seminavis robusta]|eukprot:Sro913_g219480.1 Amino-acid acetyltransferase (654) ;mRNA; f:28369-30330